eukprot:TRINITY_DN32969_c0_g1_i1.p1 TRINITY_DN32969_c0_g1~~TRINITY_DN32969_c0_g1_i1.p1  ORF type:complete len:244 (+),score=75.91 TRINITY_DN32969_c0_g1_i1:83-733(+)
MAGAVPGHHKGGTHALAAAYPRSILRLLRTPESGDGDCIAVLGFEDLLRECNAIPWEFQESLSRGPYMKLAPSMKPHLSKLPTFHDYNPASEGWVLAESGGEKFFVETRAVVRHSGVFAQGTEVELLGTALDGLHGTVVGASDEVGGVRRMLVRLPGDGWPGYGAPLTLGIDNVREVLPATESHTVHLDAESSPTRYRARCIMQRRSPGTLGAPAL